MEAMAKVAGTDPVLLDADACVCVCVCVWYSCYNMSHSHFLSDYCSWWSYWGSDKGDTEERTSAVHIHLVRNGAVGCHYARACLKSAPH